MKNSALAHVVPTFSSREIFKKLWLLCPDLRDDTVTDHVVNINEYCRFTLDEVDRTPFYFRYKMSVSDSNITMFNMTLRVYRRHKTAYAIEFEQDGQIRKQSIERNGCWNWAEHDEINAFLLQWLSICSEENAGPVATLYMNEAEACIA